MRKQLIEFTEYMRVEKNYSPKTVENYYNDINQYSMMMDIDDVKNMSKQNIRSYLAKLTDMEIAPSSRNRKLAAIRSFCIFLCEEGHIQFNPAADIKTAKLDKKLPITMSEQEASDVIASATTVRDKAVLVLFYATGVRVDELVHMKYGDFNFLTRRVRVFGKGSKERILPLTNTAVDAVNSLITLAGGDVEPDNYLFPSPVNTGNHITTRAVYDLVIKYTKANNLAGISPHKIRHTFASHLHANGMDIRGIQELLGHADISTTQIYTKLLQDNLFRSYHSAHPMG